MLLALLEYQSSVVELRIIIVLNQHRSCLAFGNTTTSSALLALTTEDIFCFDLHVYGKRTSICTSTNMQHSVEMCSCDKPYVGDPARCTIP
jgi:hypothetical protein